MGRFFRYKRKYKRFWTDRRGRIHENKKPNTYEKHKYFRKKDTYLEE